MNRQRRLTAATVLSLTGGSASFLLSGIAIGRGHPDEWGEPWVFIASLLAGVLVIAAYLLAEKFDKR